MCNHYKGIIDDMLISYNNWTEKKQIYDRRVEFYYKNIEKASFYNVKEPTMIEFNYCPCCGIKFE